MCLKSLLVLLSVGVTKGCGVKGAVAKQINATQGNIRGEFIPGMGADGVSYIWIPWYRGKAKEDTYVEFTIEACTETEIKMAAQVIAPSGSDDSVFLQMDNEAKVFFPVGSRTGKKWTWRTLKTPFKLTAGKHRLRVKHREDGTKIAKLRIQSGDANICGECGCGVAMVDADGDFTYDCNDKCKADPLKTEPLLCGCGQIDNTDIRHEEVALGQTRNLKAGAPYPLGAPGDVTCGGNSHGAKCMFPFEYQGKTYNTCIRDGHTQAWCRSGAGTSTGLRYGNCDCPGRYACAEAINGVNNRVWSGWWKIADFNTTDAQAKCLRECYKREDCHYGMLTLPLHPDYPKMPDNKKYFNCRLYRSCNETKLWHYPVKSFVITREKCPMLEPIVLKSGAACTHGRPPLIPLNNTNEDTNVKSGLKACVNSCTKDSQCAPGLKCSQRKNGEAVPGCSGKGGRRHWNYCYDPRELSRDVDLGAAKMTPKECMQAVMRNKLCDQTYFNLGDDGKCSCVGPSTDCTSAALQKDSTGSKIYTIAVDLCRDNKDKHTPGVCGCDKPEGADSDGDGTADCVDKCPKDPQKTSAGLCGCGKKDSVRMDWLRISLGHPRETCSHLERISYTRKEKSLQGCQQACIRDPRCFFLFWQSAKDLRKPENAKDNTLCSLYQSCALATRYGGDGINFALKRTNCGEPLPAPTKPPIVSDNKGKCSAIDSGLPSHKQPSGFPQMLLSGANVLPASAKYQLLVLRKLDRSKCAAQAVARSYDTHGWEGVMPEPWVGLKTDCTAKACKVVVTKGDEYRVDAFERTKKPTADESASRFLSQVSFGGTRADITAFLQTTAPSSFIDPTDTSRFKAWLDKQVALPATQLREYWRKRTNQRVALGSQAGNVIQPCEEQSRWHRYTWTQLDKLKEIEVRSNPKLKLFEFYTEGVLRTQSKYFLRGAKNVYAEWDSSAPASKTYILCTVKEYVNGLLKLRVGRGANSYHGRGCNLISRNPLIRLSKADARVTQVFSTAASTHLTPIRGYRDSSWDYLNFRGNQVFIMTKTPGSKCNMKQFGGVSFAGFKDNAGTCKAVEFAPNKGSMEAAGWSLKFTNTDANDKELAKHCNKKEYSSGWWGWSVGKPHPVGKGNDEVGVASFQFKGKGTATLRFSNCRYGTVNVYLNKKKIAFATYQREQVVVFDFENGNLLELKDEGGHSVVKIISMRISCASVVYYRWDPRLRLLENTLAKPAQIPPNTQASCPNVPRTFVNRDFCQRRDSGACAPLVFQRGKRITLDEDTVKAFYSEGNKHVHKIVGLRLEDTYAKSPCLEGTVSRWTKVTGPCSSALDSATKNAMATAIRTSSDPNPETKDVIVTNSVPLKDFVTINARKTCVQSNTREPSEAECKKYASQTPGVTFEQAPIGLAKASGCIVLKGKAYFQRNEKPNQKCFSSAKCVCVSGTCSTNQKSIGAKVSVDGVCWQHVHPLYNSVIDFSYWTLRHDGNHELENLGLPNPIAKPARAGLVELKFPQSHAMKRWKDRFKYFKGVLGRFGDRVDFADLPQDLQTKKLSKYFGVSSRMGSGAFEACGSPGEVANVQHMGHRYLFPTEEQDDFDWAPLRDRHDAVDGKLIVWANVAMKAKDQLRHRMAWALSQIFVLSESGADGQKEDIEPWASYYDVFVNNAFGNYFDVMKQVSNHPLMSVFLTFLNNKAYQATKKYPDENYAREIMQLFSIGLIKMNRDGSLVKDKEGKLVPTYDNDNITPFARLWTGFSNQPTRANIEADRGTSTPNLIDPLQMKYQYRDRFPKASLDTGYLGDTYYPLCSELPPQPFLAPGARYEYTGEASLEGPAFDQDKYPPERTHKFDVEDTTTVMCSGRALWGSGVRDLASCRRYCFLNDGVTISHGTARKKCTHVFWASTEDRKDQADTRPRCWLFDEAGCSGKYNMLKDVGHPMVQEKIVRGQCGGDGKSCTRGRFKPATTSALYAKLCAKKANGKCSFPVEVRLDSRLKCTGKQECGADMVRVVQMVDPAASKTVYYTFIPPKCVRQQFFDGRVIKHDGDARSQCANPQVAGIAANLCCDSNMDIMYQPTDQCLFQGEIMKFTTAQQRCAAAFKDVGGQLCNHHDVNADFNVVQCGPSQHAWTSTPCKVQANVHPDGSINIYGRGYNSELRLLSGNNFQVHWQTSSADSERNFPTIGTKSDKAKSAASCDGGYFNNVTRTTYGVKRKKQNDVYAYSATDFSVEWDVYGCEAGAHTISVEYALGGGFRDTKISVNGGQVSTVAYQPTGSWSVYKKSYGMIFDLKAGKNTVRIEVHGFNVPFIRALHVNSAVNRACTAKGCVAIKVGAGSCLCDVEVENKAVYTAPTQPPPPREELLNTLFIGATHPADFNGEYTKCTLTACTARSGVTVWTKGKSASPKALDLHTIFVLTNDKAWQRPGLGKTVPLLNRASTVHIGGGATSGKGFSFRNPGNFMPNVGEMYTGLPGWTEDFRSPNAEHETDALLNHLFWHPTVSPYVAKQLIQRFTSSNPSPRYVEAVSMAFVNGAYGSQKFSSKYGDLKAALYATLLDPEARSPALVADPQAGKMNEPLQEVLKVMRALEFESANDQEIPLAYQLQYKVGMAAFRSETVFNFYQPDYAPPGRVADALLVAPETQIMTGPQLISMASGLHSLFNFGMTNCMGGFGRRFDKSCGNRAEALRTADGKLTFAPTKADDPKAVVQELALLLTDGRLNDVARAVVENAYARLLEILDKDRALKAALKLLVFTSEFHSTNLNLLSGKRRRQAVETPSQGRIYKAVVVLYLGGGADLYNLLVPKSGCGADGVDQDYATVRGVVGLDQSSLLPISVDSDSPQQPCSTFGIHPSFPLLKELYDAKECSFVANIGGLVAPMTKKQYKDRSVKKPRSLFSHNFMTKYAMNVHTDYQDADGVLGRLIGSSVNKPNKFKSAIYSIAGRSKMVKGELVETIVNQNTGIARMPGLGVIEDDVAKFTEQTSASMFGETYASNLEYALKWSEDLGVKLDKAAVNTTFNFDNDEGGGNLARQLEQVAKLIKLDVNKLGTERAAYFTSLGGWDGHGANHMESLQSKFAQMNSAIKDFVAEMKFQKLWNNVVFVTSSDFGRTITPNSAGGTDHAWGNNHFVCGGAVHGGRVQGKYPDSLRQGTDLDVGRGRIIPEYSWESMWHPIASWFGVKGEQMSNVLPNWKRFEDKLIAPNQFFDVEKEPVNNGCQDACTGDDGEGSSSSGDDAQDDGVVGAVVGTFIVLLLLGGAAALVFFFIRKRTQTKSDSVPSRAVARVISFTSTPVHKSNAASAHDTAGRQSATTLAASPPPVSRRNKPAPPPPVSRRNKPKRQHTPIQNTDDVEESSSQSLPPSLPSRKNKKKIRNSKNSQKRGPPKEAAPPPPPPMSHE